MSNTPQTTPAEQGKSGKVGYCRPPVATRFQPGRSGNLAGRPTAGATVREWINVLGSRTVAEVRAVAQDSTAPALKRGAARLLLLACSTDLTPAGNPVATPALALVLKLTVGRPHRAPRTEHGTGPADVVPPRPPGPPVDVARIEAELTALVDAATRPARPVAQTVVAVAEHATAGRAPVGRRRRSRDRPGHRPDRDRRPGPKAAPPVSRRPDPTERVAMETLTPIGPRSEPRSARRTP